MTNRLMMLLVLAAFALPPGAVAADEPADADVAANEQPRLHTVAEENLTLRARITGRLESGVTYRLRLLPEAYTGPIHVEEVHHRGGRVSEGDTILTIDPTRLDETIEQAQKQLDDQSRRLAHARTELPVLKERQATQLEQHEIALDRARTDLDIWNSYQGPRMLKNAELSVRQMENFVSNQREELQQLEQMYEGTELDSETKEIVLERARRSLEIAEERLTISRNDRHVTETVTHPQRTEDVNNTARYREEALTHLKINNAIALERKHAEIESLEVSIAETQRRLSRLKSDRAQLTVRAPATGLMTHVDLEPDDSINARQVIAHVHDPSQRVLRVELTAADLRIVREGDAFDLRVPEYPELSFTGELKQIAPIGRARDDETVFDAEIHVAGENPLLRLGLRITGRAERTLENVLVIPRSAVTERDGEHFVSVLAPGEADAEPREVAVTLGAGNDEFVQVVRGLSAGDRIVLHEKE